MFVMSALGMGASGFATAPVFAKEVRLPLATYRLTRRLSRGLRDGTAIIVTRSWNVSFARQARGFAITGEQSAVLVEAPEHLAPIAKIEEERSSEGMFPILLAPDGTIMAAGQSTSQASFNASVATAQDLLEQSGLAKGRVEQQGVYMAQLQKAGSSLLDELPGDLFFPSTAPFREVRKVALPDGGTGEFELRWVASVVEGTSRLDKAQREVITRIGSSERRSSEDWSLTPL